MKNSLVIFLIVILTTILSGLAGFILWPVPIVAYLYLKSQSSLKVYGAAFGFGVVQDLVTGFPLGFSALILICYSLALFFVGSKFRADLKVVFGLGIVFELIYLLLFNFLIF